MARNSLLEINRVKWSEMEDGKEWDDFVISNEGSVFHMWAWRKVLEGDESRPLYLTCRDPMGRVLAVCPFFYRTGRHLQYLDSLPWSHMAGPIVDKQAADPLVIIRSLRRAVRFSPFKPVIAMRVKVHQEQLVQIMSGLGFQHNMTQLFIVDLHETGPDHVWKNGFQKHDRQAIKYYERAGATLGFLERENDYVEYVNLKRGLKDARMEGEEFLGKIRTHMADKLKVVSVLLNGRIVAGTMLLCNPPNSTVSILRTRFAETGKNIHSLITLLNWRVINWAHENGLRYVDFGSYPTASSLDPRRHPYKLRARFEANLVPRYEFILPTSDVSYSVLRRIGRLL